jgi:hypothetical protein
MSTYQTQLGYIARDTISGIEVYEDGKVVCLIENATLDKYRDENEDIDDDLLEKDIKEICEAQEFLDYQKEYC